MGGCTSLLGTRVVYGRVLGVPLRPVRRVLGGGVSQACQEGLRSLSGESQRVSGACQEGLREAVWACSEGPGRSEGGVPGRSEGGVPGGRREVSLGVWEVFLLVHGSFSLVLMSVLVGTQSVLGAPLRSSCVLLHRLKPQSGEKDPSRGVPNCLRTVSELSLMSLRASELFLMSLRASELS